MCFDTDGESSDVWEETWQRARKEHACDECRETILVGEVYQRIGSLYDGRWSTFRFCPACLYLQALLYAQERSEGCLYQESWYPMGDGEMRRYAYDMGWRGGVVEQHRRKEQRA